MEVSMKKILIPALILAALPGALFAEWKVVNEKSSIGFTAYSRMHDADGIFKKWDFSGKVNDDFTGQGKISIDIVSIDTNDAKRDKHLKTADFFNAPTFPKATYEIKNMKVAGDKVDVTGVLTIMAVSKPLSMTLKKTLNGSGAELTGQADINRIEYGVKGNSGMNPIQDKATIKVKIALKK
jgi:polyisoprenoid-binding protein YceI